MKDIRKVIKDYEYKLYEDEDYEKINDGYIELLFRTRILFKHDLCELIIIKDLDNYSRLNSFTSFIVKRSSYYYLYKESKTGKLLFITKASYGTGVTTGIALGIDHISDEDFEKLLELEEADKVKKVSEIPNPIPKEVYWVAVFLFLLVFLGNSFGPSISIIAIIGFVIFLNKKQISEAIAKNNKLNTVKTDIVEEDDIIEEKPIITKVTKTKEIIKKPMKNRSKKRERY